MARLKQDPNKKHYFAEVEPSELKEILDKCINDKIEIKVWEQGKSDKELETYFASGFDPSTRTVFLTSAGGFLSKLSSSKLIDKDVFVKIGSDKFQFFSTTLFKQDPETKAYSIHLTRSVYRTLQRQNYRLQASSHIKIQVRIDEDTLLNGLDISAGGTAFIVPEEEKPRYDKGTIFKDCKLALNSAKFNIPTVTVAGSWPVKDTEDKPTGEWKIGVSFADITDDTEEDLFKAINGEARADEMRKKMLEKKLGNK